MHAMVWLSIAMQICAKLVKNLRGTDGSPWQNDSWGDVRCRAVCWTRRLVKQTLSVKQSNLEEGEKARENERERGRKGELSKEGKQVFDSNGAELDKRKQQRQQMSDQFYDVEDQMWMFLRSFLSVSDCLPLPRSLFTRKNTDLWSWLHWFTK